MKVTKRDGDSSLMQLKEEFRSDASLRREHDTQVESQMSFLVCLCHRDSVFLGEGE